jgi:tetratricopeptide (TPR) repeat protein
MPRFWHSEGTSSEHDHRVLSCTFSEASSLAGLPITKYCDERHLTPRARLDLFVAVCHAIQHAHQKGIIHRDIKPTNVLVTEFDGTPVPKVIDFGIAKATGHKLTERTLFTAFGGMVGTLEYMSPEQAALSALDVDTRSDIYELGVLLYELLTGTTPLLRKRLKQSALDEALRIIREEEPPKPSTRLTDSSEQLTSLAAQRNMEPAKLTRLLRGELDWLVMKALEKDRNRRYETANAFALDIERYLHDEPVQACPPSAGYRLRKFVRKYRTLLRGAAIFALLLLVGTIVSAWQAVRATEAAARATKAEEISASERDLAVRAEEATNHALEETKKAKAGLEKALLASDEARIQAEELSGFLVQTLRSPDPYRKGQDIKIVEVLDQALAEVEAPSKRSPRLTAKLLDTLGQTYTGLGLPAKAVSVLEKAKSVASDTFAPGEGDSLAIMYDLAVAYQSAGQLKKAVTLFEETLRLRRARLGPDDPLTLTTMNALGGSVFHVGTK